MQHDTESSEIPDFTDRNTLCVLAFVLCGGLFFSFLNLQEKTHKIIAYTIDMLFIIECTYIFLANERTSIITYM